LDQTTGAAYVSVLPGLQAHASGALWLPQTRTAIIADLHLGYSWAQRRRGELGPLADSQTREKLFACFDALQPKRLVFLGDLVHAPRPCDQERQWIEQVLLELSARAELIAVRGNHDRAFAREFSHLPVQAVEQWSQDGVSALHGDRLTFTWPEHHTLVIGHLHPSFAALDAAGAGCKLPAFLVTRRCIVLPAFSPFARGYDIISGLPREIQDCFHGELANVYVATGKRIAHLGSLAEASKRLRDSNVGAPRTFPKKRISRSIFT
jgi:uncharacterized protein